VTAQPPEQQPDHGVHFEVRVPSEQEAGVYANVLTVWHTAHEFTFDFSAALPAQPAEQSDGSAQVVQPCLVTSRVRVPVSVVFDMIRTINENLTRYEDSFGPINPPGPPEAGPPE
jgi:hypothetical protein